MNSPQPMRMLKKKICREFAISSFKLSADTGLLQAAGEELPDFFAEVNVVGVPGVDTAYDFAEPKVAVGGDAGVAVFDDGVTIGAMEALDTFGGLMGALVLRHPVANGDGHGQVSTTSVIHTATRVNNVFLTISPLSGIAITKGQILVYFSLYLNLHNVFLSY